MDSPNNARVAVLFDASEEELVALRQIVGEALVVGPASLEAVGVAIVFSFADLPDGLWGTADALQWVVSLPAGADHVPFARLPHRAQILSLHGPNATTIAEHATALLLAAAKRIVPDHEAMRAGRFDQARRSKRIAGAHLVVVGAGPIGGEVLRLGRALGMRTTCVRASGAPHPHADATVPARALHDALASADALVLAVPLTRATRGLIGARELAAMRQDAILVNVARGKLVDRDAVAAHLDAHPAFTLATDVWWRYPKDEEEGWDEPLARRPNVVATPHAAALVPEYRLAMVEAAARAVQALRAGRLPPEGRVEDPTLYAR